MITEFSKEIVNRIKNNLSYNWKISNDLGDLENEKDLLAYFGVTSASSMIYDNLTLHLDCEVVGSLLFENRTATERDELLQDLYNATMATVKGVNRYEELECGAVLLGVNPSGSIIETDDIYYSIKIPITFYVQF